MRIGADGAIRPTCARDSRHPVVFARTRQRSPDGWAWSPLPWQASFSGGQIDALATANGTLVAAGRIGYPDDDKAAVWVRSWP